MTLPTDVSGLSAANHRTHHNAMHARYNAQVWAHEYASLQHAVDAAVTRGGVVYIPPQGVTVAQPVILPRGGANGIGTVHLVGVGNKPRISGAANFPEGRALIEWERTPTRAWHQRIENVALELPNRLGVKAIHFAVTNDDTWEQISVERLQIVLQDVHIFGHNDYHDTLIDLEGCTWYSTLERVIGDCASGNNTYPTLLLRSGVDTWNTAHLGNDAPGLFNCMLRQLHCTWRRGGRGRMFEGRAFYSAFENIFSDGSSAACFVFRQSLACNLVNLATEGREEKPAMYVFEDCASMSATNIGIGTPNVFDGSGYGHGLLLQNCRDMHFSGRLIVPGNPIYSVQSEGKRLLYVDADCKRCTFDRWQVRGQDIAAEIEIAGDASNRVNYVLFGWPADNVTTGTLTGA